RREPPQGEEPEGVNRDDQRIVAGADFAPSALDPPPGVAVRQPQLADALERYQRKDNDRQAHAASSISPAQVKPGPKAVINARSGSPRLSSRSSTNNTVGALMLPKSFNTSRSRLSSPWLSSSAVSIASITLTPPGWQQKRPMSSRAMPSWAHISSTASASSASMNGGIA